MPGSGKHSSIVQLMGTAYDVIRFAGLVVVYFVFVRGFALRTLRDTDPSLIQSRTSKDFYLGGTFLIINPENLPEIT